MSLLTLFVIASFLCANSKEIVVQPVQGTTADPTVVQQQMYEQDVLQVELKQLSSAGYIWNVLEMTNNLEVTFTVVKSNVNLMGAPEQLTVSVQCKSVCKGQSASVTLVYLRPWLKDTYLNEGVEGYKTVDNGFEPGVVVVEIDFQVDYQTSILSLILKSLMKSTAESLVVQPEPGTFTNPAVLAQEMTENDKLDIVLNQTSSAGYEWSVYEQSDLLQITSKVGQPLSDLPGAPEQVTFTITCKDKCSGQNASATLIYLRPWLRDVLDEQGVEGYVAEDGVEPLAVVVEVSFASEQVSLMTEFDYEF